MTNSAALHLLLVHLKPGLPGAQRDALIGETAPLGSIDGVLHMGFIEGAGDESTHDLGLFFYLRDIAALERFGTDALHMEYLQRFFLPAVADFVGMDIAAEGEPVVEYGAAACFCLNFQPDTYDWQVRALLTQLAGATTGILGASVGRALDQRQPFRAGGVILASEPGALSGISQASREMPAITSELIAVVGAASPLG